MPTIDLFSTLLGNETSFTSLSTSSSRVAAYYVAASTITKGQVVRFAANPTKIEPYTYVSTPNPLVPWLGVAATSGTANSLILVILLGYVDPTVSGFTTPPELPTSPQPVIVTPTGTLSVVADIDETDWVIGFMSPDLDMQMIVPLRAGFNPLATWMPIGDGPFPTTGDIRGGSPFIVNAKTTGGTTVNILDSSGAGAGSLTVGDALRPSTLEGQQLLLRGETAVFENVGATTVVSLEKSVDDYIRLGATPAANGAIRLDPTAEIHVYNGTTTDRAVMTHTGEAMTLGDAAQTGTTTITGAAVTLKAGATEYLTTNIAGAVELSQALFFKPAVGTVQFEEMASDVAATTVDIQGHAAKTGAAVNKDGGTVNVRGGPPAAGGVGGSVRLKGGDNAVVVEAASGSKLSFYNGTPVTKQTITGALSTVTDAAAKAVLTSIIAALAAATGVNLVTDGTT